MLRFFLFPFVLLSLCACDVNQDKPKEPVNRKENEQESEKPTWPKPVYTYPVDETNKQNPKKDFYSIEKPLIKGEKIHPQASEDLLE
mgnify:CR=1 FL=1|tara:strand:- start:1975 stop:2235 length:261 start_codon:yes stop_codon:yes gene_type:complete